MTTEEASLGLYTQVILLVYHVPETLYPYMKQTPSMKLMRCVLLVFATYGLPTMHVHVKIVGI